VNGISTLGYAGDLSPDEAWAWVRSGEANLVDVRTLAERIWVGYVEPSLHLPWLLGAETINPEFEAGIQALGSGGRKLLLLCRSGVRSVAAARRATELGLPAYNILEGFEGDLDEKSQRGHRGGWRYHGLPWRQS
jgi:rhodanese-related sulfurtransferase